MPWRILPRNNRPFPLPRVAAAIALGLGLATLAVAEEAKFEPRHQLVARIANETGFAIENDAALDDRPARDPGGTPATRLGQLLADYNFVLMRDGDGAITRLIVIGPKQAVTRPNRTVVKTVPLAGSQAVEGIVLGRRPEPLEIHLLIDTGAGTVVLPASMMETLGYGEVDLKEAHLLTANGSIVGKIGILAAVSVGPVTARDVEVAFIDDDRIAGRALLGMSFLGRFVTNLDAVRNELTLVPK